MYVSKTMLNAAITQSIMVNAGRRYLLFLSDDSFFAFSSIDTAPSLFARPYRAA